MCVVGLFIFEGPLFLLHLFLNTCKMKAKQINSIIYGVVLGGIGILVIYIGIYGDKQVLPVDASIKTPSARSRDNSVYKYFYVQSKRLNVREFPSTSSKVVKTLDYSDKVLVYELDSTRKWGEVVSGWIFMDLVDEERPPYLPDLEIVDMSVKAVDRDYGYTDYSWLVKVTNNTGSNRKFSCSVKFLDDQGFELASDYGYDFYIRAGETKTFSEKKSLKDNLAAAFDKYSMKLDY